MPLENLKDIDDFAKIDPQWIDEVSKNLSNECKNIKTHQIRNIFSAVSRIRVLRKKEKETDFEQVERELILLKPKLAYQVGRMEKDEEKQALQKVKGLLDEAINAIPKSQNKDAALDNFFALVESIVAYHRFYAKK